MAGNFDRKLRLPRIHFQVLLHAADVRHGTNGFTSFPKEGVLRVFFALKNPTVSAANLGTKGQHATSRLPKPLREPHTLSLKLFRQYSFLGVSCSTQNKHRMPPYTALIVWFW